MARARQLPQGTNRPVQRGASPTGAPDQPGYFDENGVWQYNPQLGTVTGQPLLGTSPTGAPDRPGHFDQQGNWQPSTGQFGPGADINAPQYAGYGDLISGIDQGYENLISNTMGRAGNVGQSNQALYNDVAQQSFGTFNSLGISNAEQFNQMGEDYRGQYAGPGGIESRYQGREQDVMGLLSGLGSAESQRIDRQAYETGTSVEQNAAARGLSASTVVGAGMGAVERERNEAQRFLNESVRTQQAGALTGLRGDTLGAAQQGIGGQFNAIGQGLGTQAGFQQAGAGAASQYQGMGATAGAQANMYGLQESTRLGEAQIGAWGSTNMWAQQNEQNLWNNALGIITGLNYEQPGGNPSDFFSQPYQAGQARDSAEEVADEQRRASLYGLGSSAGVGAANLLASGGFGGGGGGGSSSGVGVGGGSNFSWQGPTTNPYRGTW